MDDAKPDNPPHGVAEEYAPYEADEPDIFDDIDEAVEAAAIAEAEKAIAEGRVISHAAMKRWLLSWGTDNPLPPPKCGD
jgi:predicted transcriptional regulator